MLKLCDLCDSHNSCASREPYLSRCDSPTWSRIVGDSCLKALRRAPLTTLGQTSYSSCRFSPSSSMPLVLAPPTPTAPASSPWASLLFWAVIALPPTSLQASCWHTPLHQSQGGGLWSMPLTNLGAVQAGWLEGVPSSFRQTSQPSRKILGRNSATYFSYASPNQL